jgi:hypothetical protein
MRTVYVYMEKDALIPCFFVSAITFIGHNMTLEVFFVLLHIKCVLLKNCRTAVRSNK